MPDPRPSSSILNPENPQIAAQVRQFRDDFETLRQRILTVIVGQEKIIDLTLTAMIAGGHVLLEGVPGLGKTLLVKTIADALHLQFNRVQFTPDLMPADLIGTKMFIDEGPGKARFEFSRGPLFCNLLLGDEINRATPKTQSALLEAMQEKTVTVGGETHTLAAPFFVLATQNPLEQEGTYPLPEAQLDRFFFKLNVRYPTADEFENILVRTTGKETTPVEPVFPGERLNSMRELSRQVPVPEPILKRVVDLVMSTHPETNVAPEIVRRYVRYGASPRAGQSCLLAAKIHALLQGRYHVASEDLLNMAIPVLNHRMLLNFEAQADGVTAQSILDEVVAIKRSQWN